MKRLCVHQICFGAHDFATCAAALERHGIGLTAVWHDKLAAIGAPRPSPCWPTTGYGRWLCVPAGC